MKTNLIKTIQFKDGSEWKEGTPVIVSVPDKMKPWRACLVNEDTKVEMTVRSYNLWRWIDGFIEPTDEMLQEAVMDGECVSLTGDWVEPDGWDSNGFPSILLVAGLL